MGVAGIGIWQLVIIFAIALLVFGSGRLRSLGGDLGGAIHGFRSALRKGPETHAENVQQDAGADSPGNP